MEERRQRLRRVAASTGVHLSAEGRYVASQEPLVYQHTRKSPRYCSLGRSSSFEILTESDRLQITETIRLRNPEAQNSRLNKI